MRLPTIPAAVRAAVLAVPAAVLAACLFALGAEADGDRPGDFDYYVLALSWNASWCAREGDARQAEQCDPRHDHGFTLHGLWPQREAGWPQYCRSAKPDPSRRQSAAMADIMGSGGLAWHQWKKHGRCADLSGADYYALSRRAYERIVRPEVFRALPRDVSLPPKVVEAAFLEANPALQPDGVTVSCRQGMLHEVRICLARDLTPRLCSPEAARDCGSATTLLPRMR